MKRLALIALPALLLASAPVLDADRHPGNDPEKQRTEASLDASSVSCPICGGNPDDFIALVNATTTCQATILLAVMRF